MAAPISEPLTAREQQVADQLVLAATNREIAEALGISYETVKEHVQHVLRKFGVERREQVAIKMLRKQLVADELRADFVVQFDQLVGEIEERVAELRSMVSVALGRKAKRKAGK